MRRFSFVLLPLSLAFVAPLSGQGRYRVVHPTHLPRVWTVDDSGGADFTDLQDAVNAAGSGDLLLVAEGSYTNPVEVRAKGLTILGDGAVPSVWQLSVRELPAGEELVLRSLLLGNRSSPATGGTLKLQDNGGTVWIEDCTIVPSVLFPSAVVGVLAEDCASVVLARTSILPTFTNTGQPAALRAQESQVHAFESQFQGSLAFFAQIPGGIGALLQDSFLYAAGCFFSGGNGSNAFCSGGVCASPGTRGGVGLNAVNAGTSPITLACTFQGGQGGNSTRGLSCGGFNCPGAPDGPPTGGPVSLVPLPLRSHELETPVRGGASYQLTSQCQPGEFVWSVYSTDLDPAYVPLYFGTQVGALPVTFVFEGVADGTGLLSKSVPVPPLRVPFERLFAQGLFFDALGNAYLGSPSVLVIVN